MINSGLERKNILKYLSSTKNYKLKFCKTIEPIPIDLFTDASFASTYENEKSISGIIVTIAGAPITWTSTSQQIASASAAESELYALTDGIKELIIVDLLAHELFNSVGDKTIYCDNTVTIAAIRDQPRKKMKTKITRTKFVRDMLKINQYNIRYIDSAGQLADFLTKVLKQSFDPSTLFII